VIVTPNGKQCVKTRVYFRA